MSVLPVVAGGFFVVAGWWGYRHAARDPEAGSAGWLSYPAGRRVGGVLTMLVGVALIVLAANVR